MRNFDFLSPTKLIFGKSTEDRVGAETLKYGSKVLLHYGGGSIKKSGLYDRITASLKASGVDFAELPGVQPNPRISLVRQGIKLCREFKANLILAVGGGSVIDSAKAIGVGALYEGDVWDFFHATRMPEKTLPVGAVLTIAAAGSEASKSCVISDDAELLKRSLNTEIIRPVFAVMNPELTYSLPPWQTACGIADIMAHAMERYFTADLNVELTDRFCEGLLRTVIRNAEIVMNDPENYDARAEIMLAGALAHNDLLSAGRMGDFASHMIEHELSAIYDVAHGAGLTVVFPAWMRYVYKKNLDRFVQFATNVWDITPSVSPEETALAGILKMTDFFKTLGLPVTLKELDIPADRIDEMAEKCIWRDGKSVGNMVPLSPDDVKNILRSAL